MSDKEIILRLLTTVERRLRTNRMLRDASVGLTMALIALVVFKLVDLISPFRGTTVLAGFTIWAIATAAYLIWRLPGADTLDRTAAHIDHKSDSHDEIKTAYWFIRNPKTSPWVDAQIQRAAKNAKEMRVEAVSPTL